MGRKITEDGTVYTGTFRFGLEYGQGERVYASDRPSVGQNLDRRKEKGEFKFGIFKREND
jgi:hypothetical protein